MEEEEEEEEKEAAAGLQSDVGAGDSSVGKQSGGQRWMTWLLLVWEVQYCLG